MTFIKAYYDEVSKNVVAKTLYVTEDEYSASKCKKGVITSEYFAISTTVKKSFMWNRTLMYNGVMYIEGLNMVIE